MNKWSHPCQTCGACCSQFQVKFNTSEDFVPFFYKIKISDSQMALKFNHPEKKRCLALDGHIGKNVHCKIYPFRPSPCHNFKASFENGIHQVRCDEARAVMGLRPLTLDDWNSQQNYTNLRNSSNTEL